MAPHGHVSHMVLCGPLWSHIVPYGPVNTSIFIVTYGWSEILTFLISKSEGWIILSQYKIQQNQLYGAKNWKLDNIAQELEKNKKNISWNSTIYYEIAKGDTSYHKIAWWSSSCNKLYTSTPIVRLKFGQPFGPESKLERVSPTKKSKKLIIRKSLYFNFFKPSLTVFKINFAA